MTDPRLAPPPGRGTTMSRPATITAETIERLRTPQGGWTRADLALMGVEWPPPSGWYKQTVGMLASAALLARLNGQPSAYPTTPPKDVPVKYHQYLRSPEWRVKRAECLNQAKHRCQLCGRTNRALEAHHNTYERLGHELPSDLIALCQECHRRYHQKPGSSKATRGNPTRAARQLIRLLNQEAQEMMLTTSERRRRKNRAMQFLAKGR